jgi:pyruvate/2-oxoglutarate dehydrogenase complex dihydrolipoamide acyltransferase (E2) component
MSKKYRSVPFSMNRRMVAASAAIGRERNNFHATTEVDITEARRLIDEHLKNTGERLSLTAYVVACLSRAVAENPFMNSFRKGRKLILLGDVTISVLVERNVSGEQVPEPFGIQAVQTKTYKQINDEIRAVQQRVDARLGELSGMPWFNFIPGFLLRSFIRIASRNIHMMTRFGAVGVTAVGMFGNDAIWFIPLSGATLTVTVGGIVKRAAGISMPFEMKEHLCLTLTFNHDIVDGAPAARFTKRFSELLRSGDLIRNQ